MKRNGLFRNIIAISVSFGAMVLLGTGSSKAVLQSNGNDGATYNLSDWMKNVRKMEEQGGAMGLSETLNDNLTSSSSSNNIDVHMQKNTEYGALAILSASSYGNPNKINDGETTTGNATGVVMKFKPEFTAAAGSDLSSNASIFKVSSLRYKNIYQPTIAGGKIGDSIDIGNWHGSTSTTWFTGPFGYTYMSTVLRNMSGSIFSYYCYGDERFGSGAAYNASNYTRAVVVQGEGI